MNKKTQVSNVNEYLKQYDRIFISDSAFSSPYSKKLVETLIQASLEKEVIILQDSVAKKYTNFVYDLNKNHLIKQKEGKILTISSTFAQAVYKLANKKYFLLLITTNDDEGYNFKKIDYDDNRVNDINAVTFDHNGSFYEYNYVPQKEDVVFNFNLNKKIEKLKINFYKISKNNQYEKTDIISSKSFAETNDYKSYTYSIDKALLFESDVFELIAYSNQYEISSKKNNFFFEDLLNWKVLVSSNSLDCVIDKNQEEMSVNLTEQKEENVNKFNYYGGKTVSLPKDQRINIEKPVGGEILYSKDNKPIKLVASSFDSQNHPKPLGSGGEGDVWETDQKDIVVKVLKNIGSEINLSTNKRDKIEFMTNVELNRGNIIWPIEAVYKNNVFVGFTMKKISGISLLTYKSKHIKQISKQNLIKMILNILETLEYLHTRNIILGDIKFENFMIDQNNPTKILFVDTDSYQIDRFPATKVTPAWAPPELNGVKVEMTHRTFENEYFQVFFLTHWLLLEQAPYSMLKINLAHSISDVQLKFEGKYPYSLEENITEKYLNPNGFSIRNWSHLPGYIKKALYSVGSNKGERFDYNKRLNITEWKELFIQYDKDLNNGKLQQLDPDFNIGYYDPRKFQPIPYSVVDIDIIKKVTKEQKSLSLLRTINYALNNAKTLINQSKLANIVNILSNDNYYKDSEIEIKLLKNAGFYYHIEYSFMQ